MFKLQTSFLGNVPLVPLCAGKRNTRKPLHRRHFSRLFLLFLFEEEKQHEGESGLRLPHRCPQVGSESGTSGTNGTPLILFIFSCSTNRHEAAHFGRRPAITSG